MKIINEIEQDNKIKKDEQNFEQWIDDRYGKEEKDWEDMDVESWIEHMNRPIGS